MNENILAVNVPNGVSILIMALVGAALLALVRRAVVSRGSLPAVNRITPGAV